VNGSSVKLRLKKEKIFVPEESTYERDLWGSYLEKQDEE